MTTRIRRSTTAGAVPSSLVSGEIAVNEADGKLFYRASPSGTVTQIATGGSIPDPYDLGTYPLITISAQPASASATQGNSATFSVTAAATLPSATITYQWQLSTNSGSTWTNISGATSSSYTPTNAQSSDQGKQFRCVLSANLSVINTTAATFTYLSFSPTAVLLTSGTSYTVPTGATSMKAWAVGAGGGRASSFSGGAGGCAFKTWSVSGGQSVAYAVGAVSSVADGTGGSTTVTFSGNTITGNGGSSGNPNYGTFGGSYSGGDGGAQGGNCAAPNDVHRWGGAVGGNSNSATVPNRFRPTDVSGLLTAVSLAGGNITETGATAGAFGTGSFSSKFSGLKNAGLGGGASVSNGGTATAGGGAVVLYFT